MSIEINNESGFDIDESALQRLVLHAFDALKVHRDAELAIQLVDEGAMERLHIEWMDEPGPTDVLSFPMDELRPGSDEEPTPPGLLGDIVLCPQVAVGQAEAAGHSTLDELLLLTTHGLLHLLGFDHAEPDEEREMFGLQRDILVELRPRRAEAPAVTLAVVFFVIAFGLVAFGGLLAAIDAALSVVSRNDLLELAAARPRPKRLYAVAGDIGAHVNALNFLRIVAETFAAVLVTLAFASIFEEWWAALALSAAIMIIVSFILVGSSPRSVGRANPRGMLRYTDWLIRAVRLITGPIADALVAIGNRVTPGRPKSATFSSEEQLLSMVDEATDLDVLDADDRDLIRSIFDFNETIVRETMLPRTDMVTIEQGSTVTDAMALFLAKGVSRIPVIGESSDDVLGIIYLRDAARLAYEQPAACATTSVEELAKPALFIPESKKADDALREMQLASNHMALVVDEYGGIAGLVTMEDLIEELVGEISDEYDRDVAMSEQLSDNEFRVSARMPVDELGDLFGIELDDDEVDTVGGLLAKHVGRLPVVGSTTEVDGLHLTAERTEGRRKRVVTVLVSADQALIDAKLAFANSTDTGSTPIQDARLEQHGSAS
ncbi:MAG: rRNA maturation RNase YbeY [Microcella pacifica]